MTSSGESLRDNLLRQWNKLWPVAIYYLYVATGFLMILLCPPGIAKAFLAIYPVGNLIASLFVYLFYSNGRNRTIDFAMVAVIALSGVAALAMNSPEPLYLALPLAIIATDYSSSQAFGPRAQALVRFIQILTVAALPFSFMGFVVLRMAVSLGILLLAMRRKSFANEASFATMFTLKWDKSSAVVLSSATYFIPLILIGNVGLTSAKTAYLVYAIGATGLLRIIDYEIKHALSGAKAELTAVFLIGMTVSAIAFVTVGLAFDIRYLAMLLALPVLYYLRHLHQRVTWH